MSRDDGGDIWKKCEGQQTSSVHGVWERRDNWRNQKSHRDQPFARCRRPLQPVRENIQVQKLTDKAQQCYTQTK